METIDKIYVINLKKNFFKRFISIHQLNQYNIDNYAIIDAIDSNNYVYKNIYDNIIKNMSQSFIDNNFRIGALGCLLSHIQCIKDAVKNNYKQIIVLEDDFLLKNDFLNEFNTFYNKLNSTHSNWDLVYLGKKQGTQEIVLNPLIHSNKRLTKIIDINDIIYKPNYTTWGTHALMIKNTLFNEILSYENNIIGPIDLLMMTSYDKFNFYSIKNDLIVSDESESDILVKSHIDWGWDTSLYFKNKIKNIKNIVIFGFNTNKNHTHNYIHEMYYNFFLYYYPELNIYWTDDEVSKLNINENETIIFMSPCHMNITINLPKYANYIIHLDEFDNSGYKTIDHFIHDEKNKNIIENNNYIILTCRNGIKNVNYFESDITNKVICLPWFSNKLYNQIIKPDYNSIIKKKYICYIGSIWSLNVDVIHELINICEKNKIFLLLKGRAFGISHRNFKYLKDIDSTHKYVKFLPFSYEDDKQNENTFEFLDEKYGINGILPLQGNKHNENYISNRIIETISNGHIIITNNLITKKVFKSCIYNENVEELIKEYYIILNDKERYIDIYNKQYNEFIEKYYGYNILHKLIKFVKTVNIENNDVLIFNYNKSIFKLWFRQNNNENEYFKNITNNEEIRDLIKNNEDSIIHLTYNFDTFLIDRIMSMPNSILYCDKDISEENFRKLKSISNKYNKELTIKNTLDNYCILSSKRSGASMIVDFLQKYNKNYLVLYEIFDECNKSYEFLNINDMLNKFSIKHIKEFNDINQYFKQYADICEALDYNGIVFKLTFDCLDNIHDDKLESCVKFAKSNSRIIYVDRNCFDQYISRIFCKTHSSSNEIYNKLHNNMFSMEEFYRFVQYKNDFLDKFKLDSFYIYTTYESVVRNIKNNDISFINIPVFILDNELFKYNNLREKQNLYNIPALLTSKLWNLPNIL